MRVAVFAPPGSAWSAGRAGGRNGAHQDRQQTGDARTFFPMGAPLPVWCDQLDPQPFGVRIELGGKAARPDLLIRLMMKGLILAQNERWRRGLGMQVERVRRKAGQWRKGE